MNQKLSTWRFEAAQDKEGVIASLEEQSQELKAQLELLSTKLLASQQAVDTHSDRATELQLRDSLRRLVKFESLDKTISRKSFPSHFLSPL